MDLSFTYIQLVFGLPCLSAKGVMVMMVLSLSRNRLTAGWTQLRRIKFKPGACPTTVLISAPNGKGPVPILASNGGCAFSAASRGTVTVPPITWGIPQTVISVRQAASKMSSHWIWVGQMHRRIAAANNATA